MFLACAATIVGAETDCFVNRFEARFVNRFEARFVNRFEARFVNRFEGDKYNVLG